MVSLDGNHDNDEARKSDENVDHSHVPKGEIVLAWPGWPPTFEKHDFDEVAEGKEEVEHVGDREGFKEEETGALEAGTIHDEQIDNWSPDS